MSIELVQLRLPLAHFTLEVNAVLALPEVRERVRKMGGEVMQKDPAEFDAMIREDAAASAALVKETGLKVE